MLQLDLKYKCANSGEFYESIVNQMFSNDRSTSTVELDKKNKVVIFKVEAKDITSLKATFNSIQQLITINEKLSKVL